MKKSSIFSLALVLALVTTACGTVTVDGGQPDGGNNPDGAPQPTEQCPDSDNDGYGMLNWCVSTSTPPANWRPRSSLNVQPDCNDNDANVNPGRGNCNGHVDPCAGVTCNTGYMCQNGTCVPTNNCTPTNGSVERCDGVDNDCDGTVDEGNVCGGGCTTSNGGVETCDGRDNDCDGSVDEGSVCTPTGGTCRYRITASIGAFNGHSGLDSIHISQQEIYGAVIPVECSGRPGDAAYRSMPDGSATHSCTIELGRANAMGRLESHALQVLFRYADGFSVNACYQDTDGTAFERAGTVTVESLTPGCEVTYLNIDNRGLYSDGRPQTDRHEGCNILVNNVCPWYKPRRDARLGCTF